MIRRCVLTVLTLLVVGSFASCSGTSYFQRDRLLDRAMAFDFDDSFVFIRHKTEAAREGSFGGFGAAAAGGCACQ